MTNYKKLYGITLKEAKQIAKNKLGRLPLPGREVLIESGNKEFLLFNKNEYGLFIRNCKYELWLINLAGSFYLRQWIYPSNIYVKG